MIKDDFEELSEAQKLIKEECNFIAAFLITKNKAYGNSFAEPIHIFAKSSATEQLNVRLDDKINRLLRGVKSAKKVIREDTVLDLIGYLILKRVLTKLEKLKNKPVEDKILLQSGVLLDTDLHKFSQILL